MQNDTFVFSSDFAPILPGNCLSLDNIPIGTFIHNVEPRRGLGGLLVRTAGSKAQILRKMKEWSVIRMPSRRTSLYKF